MNAVSQSLELERAAVVENFDSKGLEVDIILPPDPKGVVLLVHGSGSSRLSPRNRFVARMLRERGLGTMLFDAETTEEREHSLEAGKSSIGLAELARRIVLATDWIQTDEHFVGLRIGYLGSGTGGAAAFMAAAERPDVVRAIVTRGARLELAHSCLPRVKAPALLIVGARDTPVFHHNRDALLMLGSESKRLEIIPGARHTFEEPGTLAAVAMHAGTWLARHLCLHPDPASSHAVVRKDS